jgi:hypothetical protein
VKTRDAVGEVPAVSSGSSYRIQSGILRTGHNGPDAGLSQKIPDGQTDLEINKFLLIIAVAAPSVNTPVARVDSDYQGPQRTVCLTDTHLQTDHEEKDKDAEQH